MDNKQEYHDLLIKIRDEILSKKSVSVNNKTGQQTSTNDYYSIGIYYKIPSNNIRIKSIEQIEDYLEYNKTDTLQGRKTLNIETNQKRVMFKSENDTDSEFTIEMVSKLILVVYIPSYVIMEIPLDAYVVTARQAKLRYYAYCHQNHYLVFVWTTDTYNTLLNSEWCFIFDEKAEKLNIEQGIERMKVWINESILENL